MDICAYIITNAEVNLPQKKESNLCFLDAPVLTYVRYTIFTPHVYRKISIEDNQQGLETSKRPCKHPHQPQSDSVELFFSPWFESFRISKKK